MKPKKRYVVWIKEVHGPWTVASATPTAESVADAHVAQIREDKTRALRAIRRAVGEDPNLEGELNGKV